MGLDMMAYVVDPDAKQVDSKDTPSENIAEWRKHPNLHGWMEQLWREKTGNKDDDFNCQEVELTEKDLDDLFEAVVLNRLPKTQGFFYGSDADSYYKGTDKAFISDALKAIAKGKKVFYNSWW